MNNLNIQKETTARLDAPPEPPSAFQPTPETPLASHLLVIASFCVFFGLFITYTLALALNHVSGITFISYTGDYAPESCIFSLIFTVGSMLYCIIIYIRYTQISFMVSRENYSPSTVSKLRMCNFVSLVFGELGAFGFGMTGCFQRRIFNILHLTGVFIGSYFSYVFFGFQIFFSFKMPSLGTPLFVKIMRILFLSGSGIILIIAPAFPLYFWVCGSNFYPVMVHNAHEIEVNDTAAIIEWVFFFMYQGFLYSFYCDLKKVALLKDRVVFLE